MTITYSLSHGGISLTTKYRYLVFGVSSAITSLGILGFGEAINEVNNLTKICNSEIKNNRDLLETNLKKLSNEIKIFGEDTDRLGNTC